MENNGDAKTCGELYLETVREFCKTDGDRVAFAVGMAYGQAEKVCNGCCMAAMFRPRSENFAQFLPMVQSIAERLGLQNRVVSYEWASNPSDACFPEPHKAAEIWIYKPADGRKWGKWLEFPVNSVLWHVHRAADCGIPNSAVDPFYHERKEYGKVADELLKTE